MFRARRYRVSLAFAAIFVLIFLHFIRSRSPPANSSFTPHAVDHSDSSANNRPPSTPPKSPPSSKDFGPENPALWGSDKLSHLDDATSDAQIVDPLDGTNIKDFSSDIATPKNGPDVPRPQFGSHDRARLEVEADLPVSHWKQTPEQFPLAPEEIIKLPTGRAKTLPKVQADFSKDESSTDKMQRVQQQSTIKAAFEHAWNGYKASAMGHDELKPVRGGFRDPFHGWGATLVDSLDTLWIMDLKEEFAIAVDHVKTIDFKSSRRKDIPLFETVIRYLGGLLGAYDISGHKYDVLLEKAIELADVLMGAFDTPNRMPTLFYKWTPEYASEMHIGSEKAVLAELGSLSVEFTRLAQLTKNDKYYDAIARITYELEMFQSQTKLPGLWPTKVDVSGCKKLNHEIPRDDLLNAPTPAPKSTQASAPMLSQVVRPVPTDLESYKKLFERRNLGSLSEDAEPAEEGTSDLETQGSSASSYKDCTGDLTNSPGSEDKFSLASLADSTYEYLPKEYMLLGGLNDQYRTMYEKAMDTVRQHLLFRPMVKDNRDIRFLGTLSLTKPIAKHAPDSDAMLYEGSHLACFAGGMFALGSKLFEIDGDLDLATKLTEGCIWAYEVTKTGIMPDKFVLHPCKEGQPCVWNETDYWSALDPQAEVRTARVEETKSDSKKTQNSINKRGSESATTSTDKADNKSAKDKEERETATSNKVLSHEQYVTSRILSERLPPGMTRIMTRSYLLRPEAIESIFYMYRITGDKHWREKGWEMFEAISKYTYTDLAHSAIKDVTTDAPDMLDQMESFWLAETLKYFYLLFSDPKVVSLDEYILNTEAHPFKRPEY